MVDKMLKLTESAALKKVSTIWKYIVRISKLNFLVIFKRNGIRLWILCFWSDIS